MLTGPAVLHGQRSPVGVGHQVAAHAFDGEELGQHGAVASSGSEVHAAFLAGGPRRPYPVVTVSYKPAPAGPVRGHR